MNSSRRDAIIGQIDAAIMALRQTPLGAGKIQSAIVAEGISRLERERSWILSHPAVDGAAVPFAGVGESR
jgi:hypothetical protein